MLRNLKLAILRHFEVGDSYLIKFRVIFSVGYYEVWVKAPDSSDCGVMQARSCRERCAVVYSRVSPAGAPLNVYGKLWKRRWRCLGAVLGICIHQVTCAYARTQRVRRLAIFCWGTVFLKKNALSRRLRPRLFLLKRALAKERFVARLGSRE